MPQEAGFTAATRAFFRCLRVDYGFTRDFGVLPRAKPNGKYDSQSIQEDLAMSILTLLGLLNFTLAMSILTP